jgi:acetyl esterase/lipase
VVLFVHGGAWRFGDKAMVGSKPQAFVDQGYLFASANYRLEDSVSPREQAGDVAQAVTWLHDHVEEHGGAPGKIFLMGHSAGAHLVALVGTDERLLKACGLGLEVVSGVVLLDGAGYDVPRQVAGARLERMRELYERAFGDDEGAQREASPVTHVEPGKAYPPFLIFHVGRRQDSQEQSELLAGKLREAGGQARTLHAPDKNHLTLNRELGLPGDKPTGRICEFLKDMSGGE